MTRCAQDPVDAAGRCAAPKPSAFAAQPGIRKDSARIATRVTRPAGKGLAVTVHRSPHSSRASLSRLRCLNSRLVHLSARSSSFLTSRSKDCCWCLGEVAPCLAMRLVAGFVGAAEPLLHFGPRGFGRGDALIEILDDLVAPLVERWRISSWSWTRLRAGGPPIMSKAGAGMGLGVRRSLACFHQLVVLGERDLLVDFELRLVGDGVLDRPVLPLGIAFAFPRAETRSAPLVSRS